MVNVGIFRIGINSFVGPCSALSWPVSSPAEPVAGERLLGRAKVLTAVVAETCGQQRKKNQQTKDQKRFHDESPDW
jgi:hypothetical protein